MAPFGVTVYVMLALFLACNPIEVSADGHGVFCSTQFNWWYTHAPGAKDKLLSLAKPYATITVCDMMHNANSLYHHLVEARGLGLPNGGGSNPKCSERGDFNIGEWEFGDLGGIPAGGCAFSYPDVSHSTCRLKIFGPDEANELQWCQTAIETSMKVAKGSDGTSNPNLDLACEEHTDFDVVGSENHGDGDKLPYMSKWILMNTFINTLISMPECETATGQTISLASSGSEGKFASAWSFLLIGAACGILVGVLGTIAAGAIIRRRGEICNRCLVKPLCPRAEATVADTSA